MPSDIALSFAAGHPAFPGHFPGRPIVPGVLLLDAAVHAVLQAHGGASEGAGTCTVTSAKFLSPVSPGEVLSLSLGDLQQGQVRFAITGAGRQVATGVLGLRDTA